MKGKTPGLIYLVQPPLVQLNAPYPAPYYLKTFLDARGYRTRVQDHSIGLFEGIFCKTGLEKIFTDARRIYQNRGSPDAGEGFVPDLSNPYILSQTERFLSEEDRWLACIGRLVGFLRGRDREWGHLLSLANGVLPGGPRFDACLASLGGNPPPDAAPLLAGKLLADLADFIGSVLDPSFGLVRYAGAPAAAYRDFSAVKDSPRRYIMAEFYRPFLEAVWDLVAREVGPGETMVLVITIPFSGCLAGALTCSASARGRFGAACTAIAGGGYVNTELRFLEDETFFDYFDYLSFDRGYGSLEAILHRLEGRGGGPDQAEPVLYKTLYRASADRRIIGSPDRPGGDDTPGLRLDREASRTVFPDYGEVDFSRYLYPVDEVNPMHRLWSDGHWLKAYLAHGCYWHSCAFCDTALDYIREFAPVDTGALFRHLLDQAEKTGVRGVHLVDEAAPAASLIALAELNIREGLPLVFWGNIRFEKDFTPDTAAFLAAGGLLGVSGGIEVASEAGFRRVRKGLGLPEVIRAAAAFKEAGILTHAYLIYGYWDETPEEIINSAEILRRLFAAGLLDSAFWHQFILTRHSPLYAEWQRGLHPGLRVSDPRSSGPGGRGKIFALNDLSFAGEERFNRFAEPLDQLLAAWMAGDTARPVEGAFPFRVPSPSVPPGLVADLLDAYARDRDEERGALPPETGRVCFLGSRPLEEDSPPGPSLFWRWRLSAERLCLPASAGKVKTLLGKASLPGRLSPAAFYRELEGLVGSGQVRGVWKNLRNRGLVIIP
ncbi:radical SAM protein [Treponema sp. TIM-1]|uniref:B12-binding domain-containing radical SAM protein n=1 Tax=Treponema sp. TIM-1 TaxID=2898417 RepID=UPI00397FD10F